MSWLKNILSGGALSKVVEIGAKAVINKDKLLKLAADGDDAKLKAYIADYLAEVCFV